MRSLNYIRQLSGATLLTVALAFQAIGQTNLPPEILAADATNYLGQEVVVRDVVAQVALRSTVALLNLNREYPHSPLTCVIRSNQTNKFPELEIYLGQRVEIAGLITDYQGRPQIVLTTTNQIKILSPAPISLKPLHATGEPASPAMVVDPPTSIARTAAPSSVAMETNPDHVAWRMIGLFGAGIALLGTLLLFWWWRSDENFGARGPRTALARRTATNVATTNPLTAEEWKQRALVAEAMAGRQGQILREKLMPELAEFAKQSLVQGLYAQRNALIETQQVAQQALGEMEARLATLQLSLPERIQAYEKRIGELEKEVETQGEEVRELTRATLVLVRKKLEAERERERTVGRFN